MSRQPSIDVRRFRHLDLGDEPEPEPELESKSEEWLRLWRAGVVGGPPAPEVTVTRFGEPLDLRELRDANTTRWPLREDEFVDYDEAAVRASRKATHEAMVIAGRTKRGSSAREGVARVLRDRYGVDVDDSGPNERRRGGVTGLYDPGLYDFFREY